jgi:hypothetical protein
MRQALLAIPLLAAAACGGGTGSAVATNGDVQQLNTLSQQLVAAEGSYGAAAGAMTDMTSCAGAEAGYHGQARPMIDEMQAMGPGMDQRMSGMGHPGDADLACAADAMMTELDRHHGVACVSADDMAANMAEASHHVAAMTQWADHQLARTHAMGAMSGMGMGGMGGGGMGTGHCVRNGDGTFTMAP